MLATSKLLIKQLKSRMIWTSHQASSPKKTEAIPARRWRSKARSRALSKKYNKQAMRTPNVFWKVFKKRKRTTSTERKLFVANLGKTEESFWNSMRLYEAPTCSRRETYNNSTGKRTAINHSYRRRMTPLSRRLAWWILKGWSQGSTRARLSFQASSTWICNWRSQATW